MCIGDSVFLIHDQHWLRLNVGDGMTGMTERKIKGDPSKSQGKWGGI